MSASAESEASPNQSPEAGSTWVRSSFWRDLAGLVAWGFVLLPVIYIALVWSAFGESGLLTWIWVLPTTLILLVALTPFDFLPLVSVRWIVVRPESVAIVRFREVEVYPWTGLKAG